MTLTPELLVLIASILVFGIVISKTGFRFEFLFYLFC